MWKVEEEDEFFIGYAPPMPPRLARFVSRVVIGTGLLTMIWAGALAAGHVSLDGGTFEFGRPSSFEGTIVERPYPAVRLEGTDSVVALLVAPGKHGADALIRGMDGRHAAFTGTRIQRGPYVMIEVEPGSLEARQQEHSSSSVVESPEESSDRLIELTGEIVDPKCFLGVMVPGSGKTHKDCASLCLRGGIPPALYVQDRTGSSALLPLTDLNSKPIVAPAIHAAGEAISMVGLILRKDGLMVLRTDPATWRALER